MVYWNNTWEVNVPAVSVSKAGRQWERAVQGEEETRPQRKLTLNHSLLGYHKGCGFHTAGDKPLDNFHPMQDMTELHDCACSCEENELQKGKGKSRKTR